MPRRCNGSGKACAGLSPCFGQCGVTHVFQRQFQLWSVLRATGSIDRGAATSTVRRGHRRRVTQCRSGWRPFRRAPFPAGREHPLGFSPRGVLRNAIKYSPDEAAVTVRLDAEEARRSARVAVQDAGPGLPPEEQRRVWEPFHRAPAVAVCSGSAGKTGSLGLGLHVCKIIIEGHGGQVGVESVEGQGSTFWFSPLSARRPLPKGMG